MYWSIIFADLYISPQSQRVLLDFCFNQSGYLDIHFNSNIWISLCIGGSTLF